MSITIPKMNDLHLDDNTLIENLISSFFIGMILGSMILGLLTHKIGRKTVLFIATLIHIGALFG